MSKNRLRDPATDLEIRGFFNNELNELQRLTNRVFRYLLLGQWAFAVVCAVAISPLTWSGDESSLHTHVVVAVGLGGLLAGLPLHLMRVAPHSPTTRLTIASAQVLFSSLLIHLMGGRIEAHFHVFGSLALLSFYRDPWVFLPSVAIVFFDHLLRGVFWPESVFGVLTPSAWRALEHAAWVLFETVFLLWGVTQSRGHLLKMATLQAHLSAERDNLDARVRDRTHELARARDFFQDIIDSIDAHLCILDREGTILTTNLAWDRFGLASGGDSSRFEVGANYLETCRSVEGECRDGALAVARVIQSIIDGDTDRHSLDFAFHGPDEKRWLSLQASRFVNGNQAAVVIANVDVTHRVLATEESLRESQRAAALAQIIRESPNEVYVFDQRSLRFVEVNDGACASSGYEREELLAMTPIGLKPDFDEATFREKISPLADNATTMLEFQTEHLRKDGSRYPAQISLHKAQLDGLAVYVAFVSDMTGFRELEQQLSQAQKLESIGQLAAGIAHEINTPMQCVASNVSFLSDSILKFMTVIETLSTQLESSPRSWDERRSEFERVLKEVRLDFLTRNISSALDDADTASRRVMEIVRAMRAISHPGTNEMVLVEVNDIIRDAVTISKSRWKYAAELRLELTDGSLETLGYSAELSQVLLNLIVNAADAISEKNTGSEDRGLITIRTHATDETLTVEVEDSGAGIPESIRGRVFDPFFTTKEVGRGTGQGLSISHNVIVNQHGGTIDIVSTEGKGTTFILGLPRVSGEPAQDDAVEAVAH